jgi:amino acid transporter
MTSGATALASMLAPPVQPTLPPWHNWLIFAACAPLSLALGVLVIWGIVESAVDFAVLVILGLCLPVPLAVASIYSLRLALWRTRWPAAHAEWQRQISIWQRLYYCGRCDSVTDPATGNAVVAPSWPMLLAVQH